MIRKACLTLSLLTISNCASALGVGEISVESMLNQPLKARIMLFPDNRTDINNIKVYLADNEFLQRTGTEPHVSLTDLRFKPVMGADGAPYIQVTSRLPIREPYLEFFLKVVWPDGDLSRGYTFLFDLPGHQPQGTAAIIQRQEKLLLQDGNQDKAAVHPPKESEKQKEAIGDPSQETVPQHEINRELEQKIAVLQASLKEKAKKISDLNKQLHSLPSEATTSKEISPKEQTVRHDELGAASRFESPGQEVVEKGHLPEMTTVIARSGTTYPSLGYAMLTVFLVVMLPLLAILLILKAKRSTIRQDETGDHRTISRFRDNPEDVSSRAEILFRNELGNQDARLSDSDKAEARLAEADIYMAYMRYTQAESVIRDAIKQNRDDIELKAKLLEIYAAQRDKEKFTAYLVESADAIMAVSPRLWDEVAALGQKLIPDHSLIKGKAHYAMPEREALEDNLLIDSKNFGIKAKVTDNDHSEIQSFITASPKSNTTTR